ncbi:hypothetical protein C1H46_028265 [Malus baccata]|uniref:Uncharacterized protein n=1 Tax=Malus baccata TaxID=106549 RepID=A0A540LIM4_MALBA|nr:hypothetical protein C1H46_028265 [Malus baccata]
MSQTAGRLMKPGLAFVFGTMFGAFITRASLHRCHHRFHDQEGDRKHWPCPRQAQDKKIGSSPGGLETTTTRNMEN